MGVLGWLAIALAVWIAMNLGVFGAAPPSEQLFAAQTGQAGLWGRPLGALCALAGGAASSL